MTALPPGDFLQETVFQLLSSGGRSIDDIVGALEDEDRPAVDVQNLQALLASWGPCWPPPVPALTLACLLPCVCAAARGCTLTLCGPGVPQVASSPSSTSTRTSSHWGTAEWRS